MAAPFPFSDFRGFKRYVDFVKNCAPADYPPREGVGPEEQWTLDLAFEGLRSGLALTAQRLGEQPPLAEARALVDDAHAAYRRGRNNDGYSKLAALRQVLKTVRSGKCRDKGVTPARRRYTGPWWWGRKDFRR